MKDMVIYELNTWFWAYFVSPTKNKKSTGNDYYTLAASSQKSLNILVDCLEKYTLFLSKYLDYKD